MIDHDHLDLLLTILEFQSELRFHSGESIGAIAQQPANPIRWRKVLGDLVQATTQAGVIHYQSGIQVQVHAIGQVLH